MNIHNANYKTGLSILCAITFNMPQIFATQLYKLACNEPTTPYQINILYKKPLTSSEQQLIQTIRAYAKNGFPATLALYNITEKSIPQKIKRQYRQIEGRTLPFVIVDFPYSSRINHPAATFPLTVNNIKDLLKPPAALKIIDKLQKRNSMLFLLIDAQSSERSRKYEKTVIRALKSARNNRKNQKRFPQLTFIRISSDLQENKIFTDIIHNSSEELINYKGPILLPVYGRGQFLLPLLGKGINQENILDSIDILTSDSLLTQTRQLKNLHLPIAIPPKPISGTTSAIKTDNIKLTTISHVKKEADNTSWINKIENKTDDSYVSSETDNYNQLILNILISAVAILTVAGLFTISNNVHKK